MSTQQNNFPRRERLGMTRGLMLRRKVIAGIAAILMGVSLVFSGSASTQDQEFAGAWRGKFGDGGFELVIQQSGAQVAGQLNINSVIYVIKEGGIGDGNTLRFLIVRPGNVVANLPDQPIGTGELVMDEGGKSFTGKILNADVSGTRMGSSGGEAYETNTKPEGYQNLKGEIRWKKIMGVPSADASGNTPLENICEPFYVVALPAISTAENQVWDGGMYRLRPIASATRLTRGRDNDEYYRCKYEMFVPANERLNIQPGMGDASQYWKRSSHYTTQWVGGQSLAPAYPGGKVKSPIGAVVSVPARPAESRVFDKPYKSVTVDRETWLAFELGTRF